MKETVVRATARRQDAVSEIVSNWFIRESKVPVPACRVFCFPYAGGAAAIYRGWQMALPRDAELLAVELPGRGIHFRSPPIASLEVLVGRLVDVVAPLMDVPAVFFGHSNGAMIAHALALELRRRDLPQPRAMLLSAKRPPHLESRDEMAHTLPTPRFVEKLRELNGTPPEILGNDELLAFFLPMLRADFALSETCRYEPCPPLRCDARLLGGDRDADVSVDQLREWARYFEHPPQLDVLAGDHFFIHSARDEVLAVLRRAVRDCIAATRAAI
jgi:medium-chain acyl-[acyl-carrier-protein] hydrolase